MKKLVLIYILGVFTLNLYAQEPKLIVPVGHTGNIRSFEFSQNEKYVITYGHDWDIKVWETASGILVKNIAEEKNYGRIVNMNIDQKNDYILCAYDLALVFYPLLAHTPTTVLPVKEACKQVLLGPSGNIVLITTTGGNDSAQVKIYDRDLHTLYVTFPVLFGSFDDHALLSAGGTKLFISHNNFIWIYNTVTGQLVDKIPSLSKSISLQEDSSSCLLAIINKDSIACVFNIDSKQVIALPVKVFPGVDQVAFLHQQDRLLANVDDKLIIYNIKSGKIIDSLQTAPYWECIVSSRGHYLGIRPAKFWSDENLIISNLQNRNKITITANAYTPSSVEFSANDNFILNSCTDYSTQLWDYRKAKLIYNIRGNSYHWLRDLEVQNSVFSPSGLYFASAAGDNSIKVYETSSGKKICDLAGDSTEIQRIQFSNDDKYLVSTSARHVTKWDISTATIVYILPGSILLRKYGTGIHITENNKILISGSGFDTKITDFNSGKVIKAIDSLVISFQSDTSTNKIAFSFKGGLVKFYDIPKNIFCDSIVIGNEEINWIQFNHHGNLLAISSNNGSVYLYDVLHHTITDSFRINAYKISFSYDDRFLCAGITEDSYYSSINKVIIIDLLSHKIVLSKNGFNASFSHDNKHLAIAEDNRKVSLYALPHFSFLYSSIIVNENNVLVIDSLSRYDGTEGARKLLYFTCGTEVIGLDQLKDQLWVPNLAERIMKGDSINAPQLSNLNICGLTPMVEKIEAAGYDYHYTITPRRGGLGETVLYVNGIEVTRYKRSQLIKTDAGFKLVVKDEKLRPYFIAGQENAVTVKAFTARNNIASRGVTTLHMNQAKPAERPNLYAVMIGVSDYKGDKMDLKYAAKDAEDLSNTLSMSARKLLNTDGKEHVFTYNLTTNTNRYLLPEKIGIKKILEDIGTRATANDILFIFFAGHGITEGGKKQFYFLTADASEATAFDDPESVGISTQELSEWMKPANIKAQKRILIFDACNSGQAIKELVKIGSEQQNYVSARNDDNAEQIKAIEKLNEKSGLFILSASASNQNAYEAGRYTQGLLTYALLKAIKERPDILESNKYLDVSRWFNSAEKTVDNLAAETNARQEPQIVSAGNFNVGIVDTEVIAAINLPQEKALFTASNFQNGDDAIAFDDLGVNKLTNNKLEDVSAKGGVVNVISYAASSNSTDAYSLSGRYNVKGEDVTIKTNLLQNRIIKYRFEVKGSKSNLEQLAENIVRVVSDWMEKNR